MSELMTRHAVDLPAPCSPLATRMGKGKQGRSAATRKALINIQPWWSTLKKGRSSSRLAPASGWGSGLRAARTAKFDRSSNSNLYNLRLPLTVGWWSRCPV